MNIVFLLGIGIAASSLVRRFMKNRCYDRLDDFLWGVLGAVLGDSLADMLASSALGILGNVMMAASCATVVLLATGAYAETHGMIRFRFPIDTKHPAHIQRRAIATIPAPITLIDIQKTRNAHATLPQKQSFSHAIPLGVEGKNRNERVLISQGEVL